MKKKIKSIRIVLNSKKTLNHKLWEKLGKPLIDKKNPPAIMNLSLIDLPNEQWKSLPGYKGKYVISNWKGKTIEWMESYPAQKPRGKFVINFLFRAKYDKS